MEFMSSLTYNLQVQVPFDRYFKPEAIQPFHKVITMEVFMKNYAPAVWPPEKRLCEELKKLQETKTNNHCYKNLLFTLSCFFLAFCYIQRGNGKGCDAKDGNPFGPFWDYYQVFLH